MIKYQLPENFAKPKNWTDKTESRKSYPREELNTLTPSRVLNIIDKSPNYWELVSSKNWCLVNYQEVFPYLVSRLSRKEKIELENTADFIIWCRFNSGDLKFYGHGSSINEDLFTISRRVSWTLNQITDEIFASVQCQLTEVESSRYKDLWLAYIQQLK